MSDDVKPGPLFKDSLDGGRVQKTFRVSHDIDGILTFEMLLGAGRDSVGLSHFLCREDVTDLCKALQTWLESPESVMVGDDAGDENAAETACGICQKPESQCACVAYGYR